MTFFFTAEFGVRFWACVEDPCMEAAGYTTDNAKRFRNGQRFMFYNSLVYLTYIEATNDQQICEVHLCAQDPPMIIMIFCVTLF
jgi:hypothetical protein